jgi:hypothetical protein
VIETRVAPRFRVDKLARIESGTLSVACTVRDLSISGARVEVTDLSTRLIPDTFLLVVPEDDLKLPCRVAWRRTFQIGIAFL